MKKFVVVASCPERLGIVHAVSAFFLQAGVSVVDAAQYTDQDQQRFYMRWECQSDRTVFESMAQLSEQFTPIATQFGMDFKVFDANAKTRTIIAVSKFG
ncbi:MAG: formyltetrahydrofolate deformylase, partial [Pseudomonadota bacterium]